MKSIIHKTALTGACAIALGIASNACSDSGAEEIGNEVATGEAEGSLNLAFGYHDGQPTPAHDVKKIRYRVVEANDPEGCDGEAVAQKTVSLEQENLPTSLDPDDGDGEQHRFGDAFFVLPPGDYLVCADPLQQDGDSSEECAPAFDGINVFAERTTEIVMISECEGNPTGAGDIVVALNDPPHIDDLTIYPSKFITTCERGKIHVSADDPNGDDLSYAWSVVTKPSGSNPWLGAYGSMAFFKSTKRGDYELKVVVTDAHGRTAALRFPMHVSEGSCGGCGPYTVTGDVEPLHQDGCKDSE